MGYIGQDEVHLESPGTPSCDSLQTSNPMQSSARDTPGHPRLVPPCRTVCNTRVNRCNPLQIDERHQAERDPSFRLLEFLEAVVMQTKCRFELFEEKLRLPAIMPPKRSACIGPPRAATPPPTEGRQYSSLILGPEFWAWSTEKKYAHLTNHAGTLVSGPSGPIPRRHPKSPSAHPE